MQNFTDKINISLFGASHEKEVGAEICGIPGGIRIDTDELSAFMKRRRPSDASFSTARKETDNVIFRSGIENSVTTGEKIRLTIENTDQKSSDYENISNILRPGHSDYASFLKFGKILPGGGAFSGRMTAPICAAGFIALTYLKKKGITVGAHIESLGGITDRRFDDLNITEEELENLKKDTFPVITKRAKEEMLREITSAKEDGDSLGGIIECAAIGVPAGTGDLFFGNLESKISSVMFAVPAVKGIEFGTGFAAADIRGHENNDAFYTDGKKIYTKTNNCGGILGGIATGMPIVFRVAIKPTPSISAEQDSVCVSEMTNTKIKISGRHDTCIVPRALPVIEACTALALLNALV